MNGGRTGDGPETASGTDRRLTRRGTLRAAATAGAVTAGATGVASAQSASIGDWLSDVPNFESVADRRGQDEVTVEVGVSTSAGPYGFGPPAVRVDPGTTITFEWVSNTHNVVIEQSPTDWEGITDIHNTGFSASHTFETTGVYTYFCRPHRSLGMKGAIIVGDVEVSTASGGGGWSWEPPGNGFEETFLAAVGTILVTSVLAVLGAETLRSRREAKQARAAEIPEGGVDHTEEAPEREADRELGHDDYDPVGTASLIVVYFLLLIALWVFMYFVEFLGNGPTVVG
ncbi:MAG: halocyanin domain-containing protein [Halobacteriaceae archaeon]